MNSGVLLMRNNDWTRDVIAQMASYGTHPMDVASEEVRGAVPLMAVSIEAAMLPANALWPCVPCCAHTHVR
jgi:hypothetical protein